MVSELDLLLDLGLPALVFLSLAVWLIRKAVKAARTEEGLEKDRFEGSLADELAKGRAVAAGHAPPPSASPSPSSSKVLWKHTTATHTVWCERLEGDREVVRVSRLSSGEVIAEFG